MSLGAQLYRRSDASEISAMPPTQCEKLSRMDAEAASIALQRETEALFWRFSRRHGVTPDEARILILDTGVRLAEDVAKVGARL